MNSTTNNKSKVSNMLFLKFKKNVSLQKGTGNYELKYVKRTC